MAKKENFLDSNNIRTDLGIQLDWLSNVFSLYTKHYALKKTNSGYYLKYKKPKINLLSLKNVDKHIILEYFFAVTDTYAFGVNKAEYESSKKGFLENLTLAKALYDKIPLAERKSFAASRMIIFILSLHQMGIVTEQYLIETKKYQKEIKDSPQRKELSKELKLAQQNIKPWEISIKKARTRSKETFSLLLKELKKDGLLNGPIRTENVLDFEIVIILPKERIELILETGRIKSAWETQILRYPGYYSIRDYRERIMGIRGMGSKNHPHPIYGLLLLKGEKYSNKYYGDIKITLKESLISRSLFTFGDTFEQYAKFALSINEATKIAQLKKEINQIKAKQLLYITTGKEIETQILGGVSLDDIKTVTVPKSNMLSPIVEERLKRKGITVIISSI